MTSHTQYRPWAWFLILLTLTGCGTLSTKTPPGEQHYSKLQQLKRWNAEGKLSIQVAGERHNAAFDWKQIKKNYVIHLFGPFGWGSTWVRRTSKSVTLDSSEHGTLRAATPEDLLLQAAGWNAPISALQYWMLGTPSPELTLENIDQEPLGFVTQMEQEGWSIQFSKPTLRNGWQLPGKIVAIKDDVKVIVVIKQWTLDGTAL